MRLSRDVMLIGSLSKVRLKIFEEDKNQGQITKFVMLSTEGFEL